MTAVPHPIRRKIDRQYQFISQLLAHFPILFKEWENGLLMELKKQAKIDSGGDWEVEQSIYSQNVSSLEECGEEIPLFYNSMALTIYSYYDSIVRLIARGCGTKALVKAICDTKGLSLVDSLLQSIDKVDSEMRIIRNHIAHNNAGTTSLNKEKDLKELSRKEEDLNYDGGVLAILGDKYLNVILDQEYTILSALADKLGYKYKHI